VHGVLNLASGGQARVFARVHVLFRNGSVVRATEVVTLTPL
jgi:hypothetical protein